MSRLRIIAIVVADFLIRKWMTTATALQVCECCLILLDKQKYSVFYHKEDWPFGTFYDIILIFVLNWFFSFK